MTTSRVQDRQPPNLGRRLHRWAGLKLSLFLVLVCASGTLAVVGHELDWLLRPAMWVLPTVAASDRISWGEAHAAVGQHAPEADMWLIHAPLHRAAAFDAVVIEAGTLRHVYLHPGSGAVTGEGSWRGVQQVLRELHSHLLLPWRLGGMRVGTLLVGLAAALLLLSALSSVWVHGRHWRRLFRYPQGLFPSSSRRLSDTRARMAVMHGFVGLCTLWFVLIVAATGLFYLAMEVGIRPVRPPGPDIGAAALPSAAAAEGRMLDHGLATLLAARPDYAVRSVFSPTAASPAFGVQGAVTGVGRLTDPSANAAWIDPADGRLLKVLDPAERGWHQRLAAINGPLHVGSFGGYPVKLLWFLAGVLLTALALTGVASHVVALARAEAMPMTWRYGLVSAWRGMGQARWLVVAMTLAPIFSVLIATFR